jgi:uncharacterized membrane protein
VPKGLPPEGQPSEGRAGVARIEAFSDGVLAIILTIMVLELKAPEQDGFAALFPLWHVFFAYVLSYFYVAIYWVNHHRLFSHARKVTNELLWANIALLFALSVLPFTTAYVGKLFSPFSSALYLAGLLAPAGAYHWLQKVIWRTGAQDEASRTYHRATMRKGLAAAAVYALAIPLSYVSPGIGLSLAGLMALFWMLPWGPLDRLFLGREQ